MRVTFLVAVALLAAWWARDEAVRASDGDGSSGGAFILTILSVAAAFSAGLLA